MKPKIVLVPVGTLGDVHPFIAVAARLQEHGCHAVIAGAPEYRDNVLAAGIPFHAVRPGLEDVLRHFGMDQGEFMRRLARDPGFILKGVVFPNLRVSYEDMTAALDGAAIVVTSALAFAARLAAEKMGIRQISMVLQPFLFFSAYDPPTVAEIPWLTPLLSRLGPRATRAVFGLVKKLAAKQSAPLQAFRRELGLSLNGADPIVDGHFSTRATIALYSKLLGEVQPDYPPHTSVVGFTFYDGEAKQSRAPDPALERFLESGDPPLVFTLGSFMVADARDFYRISVEAARALKRRAVLLGAHRAVEDAADVLTCSYVPYSVLFPRCEAIIHQGGSGTIAQALRAGRPQLIMPSFGDQPDNAARVVRLGVARSIPGRQYRTARVVKELQSLLSDPAYRHRASAVAMQVDQDDGAERAAQLLQSYC